MIDSIAKAWDSWQRFWFAKEDLLAVSVMRWPMVGMILYTHLIWTFDFEAFFADQASWQSREFVQEYQSEQFAYSFWWYIPSQWMWTAHFVSLMILSLFWIGFATPITGWFCFMIVVSYANRVPLAMYGLDQVNGIAALYLAIAPCGGRLSVDAWIRRRLQNISEASRVTGRMMNWVAKVPFWGVSQQVYAQPTSSARLSLRLFQVHLCFIYLWGGLGKLQGETWWNGEAVWLTAASLDYQSNDLTWLAHFPWLYQSLSVATWVWEISFPILVWQPYLRPWVLMVGVMMHLGIGMFLGMWTFGLAMIFMYLAFIPAETYTALWLQCVAAFRNFSPAVVES
jgi:hypothetical protein